MIVLFLGGLEVSKRDNRSNKQFHNKIIVQVPKGRHEENERNQGLL